MAKSEQQRLVQDRLWALIEPLIPPRPVPRGPGGRPRIDDRAALEGILFVLDTGSRWRDLPEQLGSGSGHTAWRRLREWQDAGVWDRLHQLVLDELSQAQSLDWSRGCIDVTEAGLTLTALRECEPNPARFDNHTEELARRQRVPLFLLLNTRV